MSKHTYLFVHQNMPAQFLHLCRHLRARGHQVVFVTKNKKNELHGVGKVIYETTRAPKPDTHVYMKTLEDGILHGQAVYRTLDGLKNKGFKPDVIIGHAGWGETLFVKDAFPTTPLLNYFEFYYNAIGQDVGFEKNSPVDVNTALSLRVKNAVALMSNASCDWGLTPTQWQFSTHPPGFQTKMSVIHEGIDTDAIKPDPKATFRTEGGKVLRAGDKVVTYVARNLEPYRGFPTFMRAIPEIQRRHPDAEILVVGMDGVSYGTKLPEGDSYKKRMLAEVEFDASRVHFTGYLHGNDFRRAMHVSAAHIYLTYPFVLSWSLMEAMASGCLILGSRTAPVEEVIIDGENGVLVDFFDPSALAERVSDVLANPKAYAAMRVAARETIVANYDLKAVCLPRQLGLVDNLMRFRAGLGR